jgi:hypothetical protein
MGNGLECGGALGRHVHPLPHDERVAKPKSLTNLCAVRDEAPGRGRLTAGCRARAGGPPGPAYRRPASSAAHAALSRTRMPRARRAEKCRTLSVTTSRAPARRALSAMWAS